MFDDDLPLHAKKKQAPKDLSSLSIDELETYISDLKAEITRSEDEIRRKKAHHAAASSIFK